MNSPNPELQASRRGHIAVFLKDEYRKEIYSDIAPKKKGFESGYLNGENKSLIHEQNVKSTSAKKTCFTKK
jgi:hypothetical protein